MQWAALVAWVATAFGGLTLFVQWARHGGFTQREGIRAGQLGSHVSVAVAGLAFWVVHLVTENAVLAWTAVALLVVVALLGISMLVISLRGRTTISRTESPAESLFPIPVVIMHGALGATTLLLATLSAGGLGS